MTHDGRAALETVLAAVLRKETSAATLVSALDRVRVFPVIRDMLDGVPAASDKTGALRACVTVRKALWRELPSDTGALADALGLERIQAKALVSVLGGLSISKAVQRLEEEGEFRDRSWGSRLMGEAAVRLADWVIAQGEVRGPSTEDRRLSLYLRELARACAELPTWFPQLSFDDISQQMTVTPPAVPGRAEEEPAQDPESGTRRSGKGDGIATPRRVPLASALDQYPRLLLVGGPGSGKSWSVRGRALKLARAALAGERPERVPVLVTAPRLEAVLAAEKPRVGDRAALSRALAESMHPDIACLSDVVDTIAGLFAEQAPVELLVDGYDEVRDQEPQLAQRLGEIISLLHPKHSRFVLTTRPSAAPQHRLSKYTALCELQPFSTAEQLHFAAAWFAQRTEPQRRVRRWISERQLEWLRSPLLLALLCRVSDSPNTVRPGTENELWEAVFNRLTAGEGRHHHPSDERVRLRKQLLGEIASLFQNDTGLRTEIAVSAVESQLSGNQTWQSLQPLVSPNTVVDDILATGVVRKVGSRDSHSLAFLHDNLRDHLLAKYLAAQVGWAEQIWRIWSQPEWEQVIGATGTLLSNPDPLIRELEIRFSDDPLNAARFTAGLVLAGGGSVCAEKRERIRDELLILLCSNDSIDRSRSALLLASLKDPQTTSLVSNLLNPALPSDVITAAMRAIAGNSSTESVEALVTCALRDDFTPAEREAAIEALAETGSDAALGALESISSDVQALPVVRAAAALHALRSFDADAAARSLLAGTDAVSTASARGLTERLLRHADTTRSLREELKVGRLDVADPYCSALLLAADPTSLDHSTRQLVRGLPTNAALDIVSASLDRLRTAAEREPLLVVLARYLLDRRQSAGLRWRMARSVPSGDSGSPVTIGGLWESFTKNLSHAEVVEVGQYLLTEADRLPQDLAELLRSAVAQGVFGPLVQALSLPVADAAPSCGPAPGADAEPGPANPEQMSGEQDLSAPKLPSIKEVLTSGHAPEIRYALLRTLRRAIPMKGADREGAAALTTVLAVGQVTDWIDAQPRVAPLAEARLVTRRYAETDVELARLRAKWPGRQEEVAHTQAPFNPLVLDARAEAALLSDNLDEAATLALASIGARQTEGKKPTLDSVSVLFAAGATAGRIASTHRQVRSYLNGFPLTAESLVLSAWLSAAIPDYSSVETDLQRLPAFMRSSADVVGLRVAAGLSEGEDFEQVASWSACMRVRALLKAAQHRAPPVICERLEQARAAALRRAQDLFTSWPPVMLDSPSNQGTPRWSWKLVDIAVEQLGKGRPDISAAIFEAVVAESPDNARFINNLGFCQMPLDRDKALRTLDRAAELFAAPFAVNVANRMLLHLLRGDPQSALDIGDDYYRRGTPTTPGSWLWNMDDPSVLDSDVDEQRYILELGRRAAMKLGRYDVAEEWDRRLRSRRANTEDTGEAGRG